MFYFQLNVLFPINKKFKNNEINVFNFNYTTNKLRLILDIVYNKSIYFPIIYSYQKLYDLI